MPRTRTERAAEPARFGALLRAKRKEAGYTIAGLAGLLRIEPAELSRIERGIGGLLDEGKIRRAARALDVSAKPLLDAAAHDLDLAFAEQWPMLK